MQSHAVSREFVAQMAILMSAVAVTIDAALPAPLPSTLYARSGDLPVLLLLIAAAVALWAAERRQAALNQR